MRNRDDDIEEVNMVLSPFDMDHLRDGAPVYKPVGDDILLILHATDDWDEHRAMWEHYNA